jgi:endogenous inhibitor of DNA gyrase (YacG/DUF329 family)
MGASTCPICGRALEGPLSNWPQLPFCSKKCKTIDLGRWLDGSYVDRLPAEEPEEELVDTDENP